MQFRRFGELEWRGSALGFGCMRLPTLDGDHARIDEPEATRLLRFAIDNGLNYLDTAYPYHGGNSEAFLGRVLRDGYRERVRVATKMPCWLIETSDDFDRYLNEQLDRLQTDRIDFYLLHALNAARWHTLHDLDVLDWAERAQANGRIGHFGFSFHDSYPVFREIIDAYDGWALCQIQYNYANTRVQAGTRGLRYAASKGLAVVIMEPLLGGKLADPPPSVQPLWDAAPEQRSPVDWALQWLWDQPEVSVVLSGMSTIDQVRSNTESAHRSQIGALNEAELASIERVSAKYEEICPIPCTQCEYCLPCTVGLRIPRLFETLNQGVMYEDLARARSRYASLTVAEQASQCAQCRECESRCPQEIPIADWMERVHEVLGEGQMYRPLSIHP